MSGHRRNEDGSLKPLRTITRVCNQRKRLNERLGTAKSPSERIGYAADHLRSLVSQQNSAKAERFATVAVDYLLNLAKQLYPDVKR